VVLAATITCTTVNPCLGTNSPDLIHGNNNYNVIYGFGGNDHFLPEGDGDIVTCAEGNDTVVASPGTDQIYGGPDGEGSAFGTDFGDPEIANLDGGQDSDAVYGGGGNDYIDAAYRDVPSEFPNTEPVDGSYGQGGNDRIYAVDGNVDIIDCGKGTRDVAFIDKGIDTTGCEKITKVNL
jgi:RTX calcium-binding nonapeptide repeat (4 copies)